MTTTAQERLIKSLQGDSLASVRRELAKKSDDLKVLALLLEDENSAVRQGVVLNPVTSAELLYLLATDKRTTIDTLRRIATHHKNADSKTLLHIINRPIRNDTWLHEIVSHPSITPEVLEELMNKHSTAPGVLLAGLTSTVMPYEAHNHLIDWKDMSHLRALADREDLSDILAFELLSVFNVNPVKFLKTTPHRPYLHLLSNPALSGSALENIAEDPQVVKLAYLPILSHPNVTAKAADMVFSQLDVKVRILMASSGILSQQTLQLLVEDDDPKVSEMASNKYFGEVR